MNLLNLISGRTAPVVRWCVLCLGLWCAVGIVAAAIPGLLRYSGRVVYRGTKTSAGSLLIELVEVKDSGEPTDELLGSTRADADGRFVLVQTQAAQGNVALVASAVRESADSSGDRRAEGYDIKSHLTRLGVLLHPSPTASNTVLVDHRQPGRSSGE